MANAHPPEIPATDPPPAAPAGTPVLIPPRRNWRPAFWQALALVVGLAVIGALIGPKLDLGWLPTSEPDGPFVTLEFHPPPDVRADGKTLSRYLQTQVAVIRSPELLNPFIEENRYTRFLAHHEGEASKEETLRFLLRRLDVRVVRGTCNVRVSTDLPNPRMSAALVNGVVQSYVVYLGAEAKATAESRNAPRLTELRGQLNRSWQEVQDLRARLTAALGRARLREEGWLTAGQPPPEEDLKSSPFGDFPEAKAALAEAQRLKTDFDQASAEQTGLLREEMDLILPREGMPTWSQAEMDYEDYLAEQGGFTDGGKRGLVARAAKSAVLGVGVAFVLILLALLRGLYAVLRPAYRREKRPISEDFPLFDPRALPLVRWTGSSEGWAVVVLEDGLLTGRLSHRWPASVSAAGHRALRDWEEAPYPALRRTCHWADVDRAVARRSGACVRFQVFPKAAKKVVFDVPCGEARHVHEAFAAKLGGRFSTEMRSGDFVVRPRPMLVGVIVSLATVAAGGLWMQDLVRVWTWYGTHLSALAFWAEAAAMLGFAYLVTCALERPATRAPGRQPFRSRVLGITMRLLGVIVFLLCAQLENFIFKAYCRGELSGPYAKRGEVDASLSLYTFSWMGMLTGALVLYFGYRIGQRRVRPTTAGQEKPTVLFLRSFADDGRHNLEPEGLYAALCGVQPSRWLAWLGPFASLHPRRMLALLGMHVGDTAEEQLGRHFPKKMRFIAVGRPGERLATGGAHRVYLEDDAWQAWVEETIVSSALVILLAGRGEGIRWEVRTLFRRKPPGQILICLAAVRASPQCYEEFRVLFEEETGRSLPVSAGKAVFVRFDADRCAQMVEPKYYHWLAWPLRARGTNLRATLDAVPALLPLVPRKAVSATVAQADPY